jgi:N-acetylated-alpha-linked acidic dipeptidase
MVSSQWYRHLGVAPGKWLGKCLDVVVFVSGSYSYGRTGYGATTLPAITEAIVYEQDVKLAEDEAKKLAKLVKKMVKGLNA